MLVDTFRALHRPGAPLLLPNAWDHASATALVAAGFAAIGTTSLGVAAAHGLPDGQGRARAETVALARRLAGLPVPVTVDIEAGFAESPTEVAALAAELADIGMAGINIEDGRGNGGLADPGRQAELIAAVRAAAPALFVNARIDTHWLTDSPPPLDHTLARAERYVRAGADGVFVPGIRAEDEIRTLVAGVAVPVNVLYLPEWRGIARVAELGVARVSTGSLLFRAAVHAAVEVAGAVRAGRPVPADIPGYAAFQSPG